MMVCMELDRKIQTMEEEIMVNPQFVKKSCGNQEEDLAPAATAQTSKANTYSMWAPQCCTDKTSLWTLSDQVIQAAFLQKKKKN